LTRSLKAQLVNGDMVTTDKEAEFKIIVKKNKEEEYSVCAKILPNMDPDIILGMDFILSNKVKFDFESMKLEIGKIEQKISLKEEKIKIEDKINDLSKIYHQINGNVSRKTKHLLNINATKIQNVGLIAHIKHKIE
ncbi:hypothetical protein DMUE_5254, partial [Dictyocoela muelleri]